ILCSMAAFKNHSAITFWNATLMNDRQKIFVKVGDTAMGQFGKIKSLADLPSDEILLNYLKEATILNLQGAKKSKGTAKGAGKELEVPDYFLEALSENEMALNYFNQFNYSDKKEYIMWKKEAKTEYTRQKRLETAIVWVSEGKGRNWKYIK
nr:YdeI/OmpD-associated family protein [Bacteroidota bacterium]